MADPSFKLRGGNSGPVVRGTPGHVLTFDADGVHVSGQPGGGSIPLPIPVADLDAVGVPDGYVLAAFGDVAMWAPVPTAFDITGFSLNGFPSLVQVGDTVTSPAFVATYNQAASSATLTDSDGHSDPLVLPATAFTSPHAFTKTSFGAGVTFTLHAMSALGADTANVGIAWGEFVYWGQQVDPGIYDQAFIEGLDLNQLRLGVGSTYNFNAGATESSFFCALSSYGLTVGNFFVGGFPFACSKIASAVPFTNANGIVEAFDVFRSDNVGLGAFDVVVQ